MQTQKDMWELTVLDAGMPSRRLDSLAAADIDGDGRIELITGGDGLFWYRPDTNEWGKAADYYARVGVLVEDIDGDGEMEIVCGEHDPFWPYRSRCRVLVYEKRDLKGISWKRYTVDCRFEHHDGTKVFEIAPGRRAIMSHGWADSLYVHVWETKRLGPGVDIAGCVAGGGNGR